MWSSGLGFLSVREALSLSQFLAVSLRRKFQKHSGICKSKRTHPSCAEWGVGSMGKLNQGALGSWEGRRAALFSVTVSSSSASGSRRAENKSCFIFKTYVKTVACPNLFCGSCYPHFAILAFSFPGCQKTLQCHSCFLLIRSTPPAFRSCIFLV